MNHKRYTLALLAIFLPMLTVVPAINWVVDPFWYFRNVEVHDFNLVKPGYHVFEREVKSALVSKLRPEAVILGSSFSEIGLPVTHPGFTNGGELRSYNLSLPWAQGSELYCYALFSLAQPDLKRLVLGGFDMNATSCAKYANIGQVDYVKLLLSKNAVRATFDTLLGQNHKQESTADGMWSYERYVDSYRTDDDVMAHFAEAFSGKLCESPLPNRELTYGQISHSKPPTDASTAGLRNIIRLALRNNIQLILIDFPKHVLEYEQERECGHMEAYWSHLWQIASIVEEEAGPDSRQVQFWSFYGYQDLNAERIRSGVPMSERLWQDHGHFNPEVGKVAFDSIFGDANGPFGHRMSTRDFDHLLAEGERERQAFLTKNSWLQQDLNELRREAYRIKSGRLAKHG